MRARFWIELVLGIACGALALLTLVSREWIEALTGWDPDHGNGTLEWALVIVLAVACLALAGAARAERARPITSDAQVAR